MRPHFTHILGGFRPNLCGRIGEGNFVSCCTFGLKPVSTRQMMRAFLSKPKVTKRQGILTFMKPLCLNCEHDEGDNVLPCGHGYCGTCIDGLLAMTQAC